MKHDRPRSLVLRHNCDEVLAAIVVTGSSTSCPVLEKPMLAVACCVDNDVYVAAGFNCLLTL
jgi:hypothetical protein